MYSIARGDRYDDSIDIKCDGKELNTQVLFGDNAETYFLLIRQYYGKSLDTYNLRYLIAYHIDQALKDEAFTNHLKGKI
tara:strand:+ start:1849 stop:2085 length:237 start_codon:yes stop_codon:yes gene_type:complete